MVGRQHEVRLLRGILDKEVSAMVAVIGRRRIGKTYLVETVCKQHMAFNLIGQQHADRASQLQNFADKLQAYSKSALPLKAPDTHRSGILSALSYFWNDWGVKNNVTLIICGSAASWMINKVVNAKGGLHNRINHLISLAPFTLYETKLYLRRQGVNLDHYQLTMLYMAMGGVPHYLQQVQKGETAAQNIQRICFDRNGLLRHEFDNLYRALFDRPEGHIEVIKVLSTKWKGLTRNEIIKTSKFTNGGGLSTILDELIKSSFITSYLPYGKKVRETLYRLTDEYSLFYLTFIEGSSTGPGVWQQLSQKRVVSTWQGYAFESLCLKHVVNIKSALGISGLHTTESSYVHRGDDVHDGIQVDLVIDRPDNAIHLCEMKYFNDEVTVTKDYARKLRSRRSAFQYFTKTKKFLFTTLMTTYGLNSNKHSLGLIDQVLTIDNLFED